MEMSTFQYVIKTKNFIRAARDIELSCAQSSYLYVQEWQLDCQLKNKSGKEEMLGTFVLENKITWI